MKRAGEFGMLPNVGVDAWTIALGSYGVYGKQKKKYLRWGMPEERAERMAIQDAEICYNKSQQSSEGAFMAPIQIDHTFFTTTSMLFRNSSTSYTREAHTSARNLRNLISGKVNEDYVAKLILRKMDIKPFNERFNAELDSQIDGTLPVGHIYNLGKPGAILLSAGFPDMSIELSATRLAEKANQSNHPFALKAVKGLVDALNRPIAVFDYGNNAKNVIVSLQYQGKQFLVGVHFNQSYRGGEISDIRGLFPKDTAEWLNWISQGKASYLDHKRIQALIDQQRINLAEVDYLDLDAVANIMDNFENPEVPEVKNDPRWSEQDWAKAKKLAKEEIREAYIKNSVNLAMFGWILPWLWRIGAVSPLLLLGSDDDEKKKELGKATKLSIFAPAEGMLYGDVGADFLSYLLTKEKELKYIGRQNPMMSDLEKMTKLLGGTDAVRGYNELFNILFGMTFGTNPESVANIVVALRDYFGRDFDSQKEVALLICRIMNCPQSQLDKIYFDEIEATGTEASQMTPAQIAERYAKYKTTASAPVLYWARTPEKEKELESKYNKKVISEAKDKISSRMTNDEVRNLLERQKQLDTQLKEINKLRDEDPKKWRDELERYYSQFTAEDYKTMGNIMNYKSRMDDLTKRFLSTRDKRELDEIAKEMMQARRELLEGNGLMLKAQ